MVKLVPMGQKRVSATLALRARVQVVQVVIGIVVGSRDGSTRKHQRAKGPQAMSQIAVIRVTVPPGNKKKAKKAVVKLPLRLRAAAVGLEKRPNGVNHVSRARVHPLLALLANLRPIRRTNPKRRKRRTSQTKPNHVKSHARNLRSKIVRRSPLEAQRAENRVVVLLVVGPLIGNTRRNLPKKTNIKTKIIPLVAIVNAMVQSSETKPDLGHETGTKNIVKILLKNEIKKATRTRNIEIVPETIVTALRLADTIQNTKIMILFIMAIAMVITNPTTNKAEIVRTLGAKADTIHESPVSWPEMRSAGSRI